MSIFSFVMENMKMKRKQDKFDLPQRGFELQIFEQVPTQNFEGNYISRAHGF